MTARPTRKRERVTRHTTFRMPPDLMKKLSDRAAREQRSRTWIVEKILRDYLSKSEKELGGVFQ
jgi:predicted transcriptional regulator